MSGIEIEHVDDKTIIFKFTNGSLNVTIKKGDLSKENCDVIVNPTNVKMIHNGGLDSIIHQTMGRFFSDQVAAVSEDSGENACPVGGARIFVAKLKRDPNVARFVINTVGPNYRKEGKELARFHLQECYCNSLSLANTYGLTSIAYPAISCGAYFFPANEAAQVGIDAIRQNSYNIKDVRFVLYEEIIYDAFVREWIDYSEKINREANVIDDRDRDCLPLIPPSKPSSSHSIISSIRLCPLCKQNQLIDEQEYLLCNLCLQLTRSEVFDRLLQQLRCAAEKSFKDLTKQCMSLEPILTLYPLTYIPSQKFDQSIHKRDSIAEHYVQSHCDKTYRNSMPMAILGDGNCFYNTFVKLGGVGTTTEASTVTPVELRARNILELILHCEQYKKRYESLGMILDELETYVRTEMVRDTNFVAVWDLFSMSTVLNIQIKSVYPKVNGTEDMNYEKLNGRLFIPLTNDDTADGNDDTINNDDTPTPVFSEVKILFSHCNKPIKGSQWVPNHFVPLLDIR